MPFRHLPRAVVNQRLSSMIGAQVCLTSGDTRHLGLIKACVGKAFTCLGKKPLGFRRQNSIPSVRISCISGDLSWYTCAANGFAEMTTPVSSRIFVVI